MGGNKYEAFKLNKANVTFEDGSIRLCNTFWLRDRCGTFGSDKPTEVLEGGARPCLWFEGKAPVDPTFGYPPAGACVEPGHLDSVKVGPIALWILAPALFCCCFCCCLWFDV